MGLFNSLVRQTPKAIRKRERRAKNRGRMITPVMPAPKPTTFARANRLPRKF